MDPARLEAQSCSIWSTDGLYRIASQPNLKDPEDFCDWLTEKYPDGFPYGIQADLLFPFLTTSMNQPWPNFQQKPFAELGSNEPGMVVFLCKEIPPRLLFQSLDEVGSGLYSHVFEAIRLDDLPGHQERVVKVGKWPNYTGNLQHEVKIMRKLAELHIQGTVQLGELVYPINGIDGNRYCFSMLPAGAPLSALDTSLIVQQIQTMALQFFSTLAELHENQFIHGDITPNNMYQSCNGQYLLGDFGASEDLDGVDPGGFFWVKEFPAMPQAIGFRYDADIDRARKALQEHKTSPSQSTIETVHFVWKSCDVSSMALVLLEVVASACFLGSSAKKIMVEQGESGIRSVLSTNQIGEGVLSALLAAADPKWDERPTAREVVGMLS